MGDYFQKNFRKCLLGTVDALLRGEELSPTTQENCAVAAREAKKAAAEGASAFEAPPPKLLLKRRPPRVKANILYRNDIFLKKNYNPQELHEKVEKFLESLSPKQRDELMKQLQKSSGAKKFLEAPKD